MVRIILAPFIWWHKWRMQRNHDMIEFFDRCRRKGIYPKSWGCSIYSTDDYIRAILEHEMWLEKWDGMGRRTDEMVHRLDGRVDGDSEKRPAGEVRALQANDEAAGRDSV